MAGLKETSVNSKRILTDVVGHGATIEKLLSAIRAERAPSSWLFVGPRAQGKKLVALGIAQALLCEKTLEACGVCPSCARVANRQSEGLILLEPENGVIKIDATREVVAQLSLSNIGRHRVVVIDEAHKMNPQAANALLKSIEEPPAGVHFILIAPTQDSVLRTIRSRSQIIRFKSLSKNELRDLGREEGDTELTHAAWAAFAQIWQSNEPAQAIATTRELVSDRDVGLKVAGHWREFARDVWCSKFDIAPLRYPNLNAGYQELHAVSEIHLANFGSLLTSVEYDLAGHCDIQLTFENLIYQARGLS